MTFSKKIFFIDDDADDRDFFCSTASEIDNDIICFCANDGIEAIDKLYHDASFIPDLIFIDLNMPKMDGIECLKKIRDFNRLENTRIYMYSTTFNPRIEEQVLHLGASGILLKPSTLMELSDALKAIILQN